LIKFFEQIALNLPDFNLDKSIVQDYNELLEFNEVLNNLINEDILALAGAYELAQLIEKTPLYEQSS
jgi:hypothetical protein